MLVDWSITMDNDMTASNEDYVKLHADYEWCKDILQRIEEILKNETLEPDDIEAIKWLVKQGLK